MYILLVSRVLVVAALFAVTGCSGVSSPTGSAPTFSLPLSSQAIGAPRSFLQSFVQPGVPVAPRQKVVTFERSSIGSDYRTKGILVFEGDQVLKSSQVYKNRRLPTNPAPFATITAPKGCPYGEALDATQTLYVAENCGGNVVEEYNEGQTTPSLTVSTGISNPLGLALDSSQNLYVSNYPASITVYAKGATSPSTTITGQGMKDPFGLALDKTNNLYIADFGADQVFEVASGSTTVTPLNLQGGLVGPDGVAIDPTTGYLWVTDGPSKQVLIYSLPSTTPIHTLTAGYVYPYAISIDAAGEVVTSNLYASPSAEVFAYAPGQYTPYATLTNGISLPTGLLLTRDP